MAVKKTSPAEAGYRLTAVIDAGSTSIRMVVAQIRDEGQLETLDSLSQSVAIGSDTFTRGRISRATTEECVKVLRNFSSVLAEYRIDPDKQVRAVATSAVREARNRDEFLDRIYMATGINIKVIEGTEVNRLTFLGIQPVLKANPVLRSDRLIGVEVGGGSTELLGMEHGRVAFAHTYRMGAYRLSEAIEERQGSDARRIKMLNMQIASGVRQCRETVEPFSGKTALLLMGSEARLAARLEKQDWDGHSLVELRVSALEKLAEKVLGMNSEQVVRQYNLALEEAQTLGPALQVYVKMAAAFSQKKVYVCAVTLRDGLLAEAVSGTAWTDDFVEQVISSVHMIGQKYHFDKAHAQCVTQNALALFEAMRDEHRLDKRHEVVLRVASMLHDIGMFISTSSHHKHSRYLIQNSEIFGLSDRSIAQVALVARYHRRALPRSGHQDYAALPRDQRLAVSKLAAILRAADAMDRSHTQALHNIKIRLKPGLVEIIPSRSGSFDAEKRALAEKGKLFEQIYGRTLVLRTRKKRG